MVPKLFLLLAIPFAVNAQVKVVGWRYDQSPGGGLRITVANVTPREVTAYSLRVVVTRSDGSRNIVYCARDLVTRVMAVELIPELRKQLGNGGIPAGSIDDYPFGEDKTVTNIEATVAAAVYYDGTADVKDALGFKPIEDGRTGVVLAMEKANKILAAAKSPSDAVKQIDALAKALNAQNDKIMGATASYLVAIQQQIVEAVAQRQDLKSVLVKQQRSLPIAQAHANLHQNGGAQ